MTKMGKSKNLQKSHHRDFLLRDRPSRISPLFLREIGNFTQKPYWQKHLIDKDTIWRLRHVAKWRQHLENSHKKRAEYSFVEILNSIPPLSPFRFVSGWYFWNTAAGLSAQFTRALLQMVIMWKLPEMGTCSSMLSRPTRPRSSILPLPSGVPAFLY